MQTSAALPYDQLEELHQTRFREVQELDLSRLFLLQSSISSLDLAAFLDLAC